MSVPRWVRDWAEARVDSEKRANNNRAGLSVKFFRAMLGKLLMWNDLCCSDSRGSRQIPAYKELIGKILQSRELVDAFSSAGRLRNDPDLSTNISILSGS
jgi:hypothetical protein